VYADLVLLYLVFHNTVTLYVSAANQKSYSLVVHTTVPFGLDNINCNVDSVCCNVVLSRLRQLLPQLPAPLSVEPHRWQYSQVCCSNCYYCSCLLALLCCFVIIIVCVKLFLLILYIIEDLSVCVHKYHDNWLHVSVSYIRPMNWRRG